MLPFCFFVLPYDYIVCFSIDREENEIRLVICIYIYLSIYLRSSREIHIGMCVSYLFPSSSYSFLFFVFRQSCLPNGSLIEPDSQTIVCIYSEWFKRTDRIVTAYTHTYSYLYFLNECMCCHNVVEYVFIWRNSSLILILILLAEYSTPSNPIPTSILSSTTINTNPIIIAPTTSLIKTEQYPQLDLNLNVHHHNYLTQQQQQQQHFKSDQNEDNDLTDQNTERNSEGSNR